MTMLLHNRLFHKLLFLKSVAILNVVVRERAIGRDVAS